MYCNFGWQPFTFSTWRSSTFTWSCLIRISTFICTLSAATWTPIFRFYGTLHPHFTVRMVGTIFTFLVLSFSAVWSVCTWPWKLVQELRSAMTTSPIQPPPSANEEDNLLDTIYQAQTQQVPQFTRPILPPLLESSPHTVVSPLIHHASTLLASNIGF